MYLLNALHSVRFARVVVGRHVDCESGHVAYSSKRVDNPEIASLWEVHVKTMFRSFTVLVDEVRLRNLTSCSFFNRYQQIAICLDGLRRKNADMVYVHYDARLPTAGANISQDTLQLAELFLEADRFKAEERWGKIF
jgi:hypothetical protein